MHLTSAVAARSAPRKALHTNIDMERAYLPSVAMWIRVNPRTDRAEYFHIQRETSPTGGDEKKQSFILFYCLTWCCLSQNFDKLFRNFPT